MDISRDDIPEYCVEILSLPVLEDIFKVASPQVKAFLDELPAYPDGARHMQGPTILLRYYDLRLEISHGIGYGISGPVFRSPSPFGRAQTCLHTPYDYSTQFGEAGWRIAPGPLSPKLAAEENLRRLPMGIEFARPIDQVTASRFAEHLARWLKGVSATGVFGEGPVRCPETEMSVNKYCCKFLLDFSRSGPRTLNWFCLSCLDFGVKVRPVWSVCFGGHVHRWGALPASGKVSIKLVGHQ